MNIGKIRRAVSGTQMLEVILFITLALYAVATILPGALNSIASASISNSTLAPLITTLVPMVAVFAIVLGFVYLLTHGRSTF